MSLYSKTPNLLTHEDFENLADITPGFVGHDLKNLFHSSVFKTIHRIWPDPQKSERPDLQTFRVTFEDVCFALNGVAPSATKQVVMDIPKVSWSDIGGNVEIKRKLKEGIELPLKVSFQTHLQKKD